MTKHLEQGSPEWLAMRRNMIGASDSPIIMQVSPFQTPYGLWAQKMGLVEVEQNDAMRRGVSMEEEARQAFNEELGVITRPKVLFDDVYHFLMASFDGVSEDGRTIVEIKCPGMKDHSIAMDGCIPDKYFPQLQHQLYVSGLKMLYYFSYRSPFDHCIIEVDRDDEYIEKMLEAEKEFYRRMIEFDPPPLTDRDYMKKDDDEWTHAASRYLYNQAQRKIYDINEEEARKELIRLSEGKNCIGGGLKLTSYARKGNVDYSKIPELEKVDLEPYRKPVSKSFRITEINENGGD